MIASVAVTPATSLVVAITSVAVTIASTFELSPLAVFLAWQKRLHTSGMAMIAFENASVPLRV
jgi:hypothetical protein